MQSSDVETVRGRVPGERPAQEFDGESLVLTRNRVLLLYGTLCAFLFVRLAAMVTLPVTDTTESRYVEMPPRRLLCRPVAMSWRSPVPNSPVPDVRW